MKPDDFLVAALARKRGLISDEQAQECVRAHEKKQFDASLLERWIDARNLNALFAESEQLVRQELDFDSGRLVAGRYRLVEMIGRGALSRVYRAQDEQLKRWVALKFLVSARPSDNERFRREARIAAMLQHPNIARVYDVFEESESLIIVMQLVEGKTLAEVRCRESEAVRALIQACRGVEYAHSQGIIHRDLKPENIMLQDESVCVLDFGLACPVDVSESRLSVPGMILGTPAYMSPEQARGKLSLVDERSDVYGLGATLYELLTGHPPFEGSTVFEIIDKVISIDPVKPSADPDLVTIVSCAMAKEPERRYASVAEFREDLDRLQRNEPIRARRPSLGYRLGRAIRRHKASFIAALLVAVATLGVAVFAAVKASLRSADRNAYVKMAQEHEAAGRWAEAQAAFEKAYTLDPGDRFVETRCNEIREKIKSELGSLKAQAELFLPIEHDLRELRLRTYVKGYRLTEAQVAAYRELEQRVEKHGASARACWVRGQIRQALSDRVGALEMYEQGLQLDPEHEGCRLFRARVMIEQALSRKIIIVHDQDGVHQRERMKGAVDCASSALEQTGGRNKVPEFERDLLEGYVRAARREKVDVYCERMIEKWRGEPFWEEFFLIRSIGEGNPFYATQVIDLRPAFADAYFWRGVIQRLGGATAGAIQDFDQAITLNPLYADAYLERGNARHDQRDFGKALLDYRKSIELCPKSAAARIDCGSVRHDMGDVQGAIREYDQALSLDPKCVGALNNRGNSWKTLGQWDKAIADLDIAIQLDPAFDVALLTRGVCWAAKGDLLKARDDFDRAVRLSPRSAQALADRGGIRAKLKDVDGALEDLDKAASLDARSAIAFHNRAIVRGMKRDFEGALADAVRALELEPQNPDGYLGRGDAYAEVAFQDKSIDKMKLAERDYLHALDLAPEHWVKRDQTQEHLRLARRQLREWINER